jgi:hypothetical protein
LRHQPGSGSAVLASRARTLLRRSLGETYSQAIEYVVSTAQRTAGAEPVSSAPPERATARGAAHRLDGAFREYLTEASPDRAEFERLARLVAGSAKVRLTGYSLSTLTAAPGATHPFARCAGALDAELAELRSWYLGLADAIVAEKPIAPPRDGGARNGQVGECVGVTLAATESPDLGQALNLLWASQHIGYLMRLAGRLAEPATQLPHGSGADI